MKFYSLSVSALLGAMIFVSNSATAQTKNLCGQKVAYQPTAIASTVSRELRAFSGIWEGVAYFNTEYSSCHAFVIQQIDASGAVFVHQAWGDAGQWAANPNDGGKTSQPWGGHIIDGQLVLISAPATYYLKINKSNPNKMEGYMILNAKNARYPVTLQRSQAF